MHRTYPRQRFTALLKRICKLLDERHQGMVDYHLEFGAITIQGKVASTIRSVRAFGSWARGASACGNLDLAVELDHHWVDGPWWGNRQLTNHSIDAVQIARVLLGRRPSVRYLPLPAALEGPQAVDPAELKLIWRTPVAGRPAFDWRAAIAAIRVDPEARRYSRAILSLPGSGSPASATARLRT